MACLDGAGPAQGEPTCNNVVPLDGPGRYEVSSMNASNDLNPSCLGDGFFADNDGPDVAFSVRFDQAQTIVFDTVGSDFDTVLSIRTNCGSELSEIDCNDDTEGRLTSRIQLRAQPGQEYIVVVHGYNDVARGNVVLNVIAP